MIHIDTGDTVFHRPSREEWLVRRVDGDRLYWFGWPPGCAALADCLLVEKATAEERQELLVSMSKAGGHRGAYARRVLAEESARVA